VLSTIPSQLVLDTPLVVRNPILMARNMRNPMSMRKVKLTKIIGRPGIDLFCKKAKGRMLTTRLEHEPVDGGKRKAHDEFNGEDDININKIAAVIANLRGEKQSSIEEAG
jgi:hypothetical protein